VSDDQFPFSWDDFEAPPHANDTGQQQKQVLGHAFSILNFEDKAMKRLIVLCCVLSVCSISYATGKFAYVINSNNPPPFGSGTGAGFIYQINKRTGVITDTFTNLSGLNGRGIAVVGNTLYYTDYPRVGDPHFIYSYNLRRHTDNGVLFSLPVAVSAIAYDGTDFYLADYNGSNTVYKYSISGTLLKTITLSLCEAYCDGLEYFERGGVGYLVSNRGDQHGPYDLYDLSGNVVTAAFIDPAHLFPAPITSQAAITPTGIAFDGKHLFTTGWLGHSLEEWDTNGVFVKEIGVSGLPQNLGTAFEDLSFDYCTVFPDREGEGSCQDF